MTVRLFSFSRNKNNFCFFCYCSSYFYKFLGIHYMARVYVFCMGVSALWMPIIKNNSKLAAKMINIWNWMCDCIEMITCTTLRHCKYKRDRKKQQQPKFPHKMRRHIHIEAHIVSRASALVCETVASTMAAVWARQWFFSGATEIVYVCGSYIA